MTSRERVRRTFAFEKTDRVPVDYSANRAVHQRVARALGVLRREEVLEALGVDFREAVLPYTGERLFPEQPGKKVHPYWGSVTRWAENENGGYWDDCDFPLADAPEEVIAGWPLPDPDDFDYSVLRDQRERFRDYALYYGNPGLVDIMNGVGMLRGMENIYMDLAMESEEVLCYIDRRLKVQLAIAERVLDAVPDLDLFWTGEDLGTQRGPLISLEMFRRLLRPRHQPFVDLARSRGIPVMIHSCGSSSWAFEDFLQMGITAVDTLQPEARDMELSDLARRFGGRLAFHGALSTGKLARMTPAETAAEVRRLLSIMEPYGGYCLTPSHLIQDNTPEENVLAIYRTAGSLKGETT